MDLDSQYLDVILPCPSSPETAVWGAVIERFLMDLRAGVKHPERLRQRALRDWHFSAHHIEDIFFNNCGFEQGFAEKFWPKVVAAVAQSISEIREGKEADRLWYRLKRFNA